MSVLKRLIKKRDVIKDQLSRFANYAQSFSNNDSVLQLQARLDRAAKFFDEFNEIQIKIECAQGKEEYDETHRTERAEFEESYYDSISLAHDHIAKRTAATTAVLKCKDPLSPTAAAQEAAHRHNVTPVKLPKIDLPVFNGAYDQWMQFYDMFKSIIHNNTSITSTEKFYYLKSSLQGDAARVISSLEVTADNYEIAWTLLQERFENKRLIVQNHVRDLFELPSINKESHVAIRQLLDSVLKHLRSLKSLDQPTDKWDTIIIHLISSKLDTVTRREWELSIKNSQLPTMKQLTDFLSQRAQVLESITSNSHHINKPQFNVKPSFNPGKHNPKINSHAAYITTQSYICPLCEKPHALFSCETFLGLSVERRKNEVKRLKRYLNCLRSGHFSNECRSRKCQRCQRNHNTLLHEDSPKSSIQGHSTENTDNQESTPEKPTPGSYHCVYKHDAHILLSTALIKIYDRRGVAHNCRVLLDSGSQSNFITEDMSRKLDLPRSKIDMSISGINQVRMEVTHRVQTKIHSMHNSYNIAITCLILSKITETIPAVPLNVSQIEIPEGIKLADPSFHIPGEVDMLIGAGVFLDLLCIGQKKLNKNQPTFQNTKFGWILAGPMSSATKIPLASNSASFVSINNTLQEQVVKFWEVEEIKREHIYSTEESLCEEEFVKSVSHNERGQFVVSLPVKSNITELGESRSEAVKRLNAIERKLEKQPELKREYVAFMEEYKDLKHMTLVEQDEEQKEDVYYMPHHAVTKEDSETTKVRVVFDASAKTSTGISLNDVLMVGPTIQDELLSIVLRFRLHRYVITADVEKMYRQVYINPEQRDFQRIVWRNEPTQPIQTFRLNTVTYGTASAPFLAVRCLHEVAKENEETHPVTSRIIRRDFYVDDLITGTETINQAKTLIHELTSILSTRGFNLRKFRSNDHAILAQTKNQTSSSSQLHIAEKESKLLGLAWNSHEDTLEYTVKSEYKIQRITKRTILSTIAQIFDPLGLIGPATIQAKVILQKLWQLQLDWDDPIPQDLHTTWIQSQKQLRTMNQIKISRNVLCINPQSIQLHAFCDASEMAYGACCYIRSTNAATEHFANLLCAKSRIAPLKTTSLPRLELCGALLLAQLIDKVKQSINITISRTICWSDSTIALSWIAGAPNQWKTFVGNRVAEIQEVTKNCEWRHVGTKHNPADILSRGTTELEKTRLWWIGPEWLTLDDTQWPSEQLMTVEEIPERKKTQIASICLNREEQLQHFQRFSSLNTLINVTAYCFRFMNNIKKASS